MGKLLTYQSCFWLHDHIEFGHTNDLHVCCYTFVDTAGCSRGAVKLVKIDGDTFPADEIKAARRRIHEEIARDAQDDCRECRYLETRDWPEKPYLADVVTMNLWTHCNLKCVYCFTLLPEYTNKIPWGVDSSRLWEQTEVVNPLNPWRRPMSLDHRCEEPTAIRSNVGAIFVSLELSRSTWLITSLSPGSGEKMSKYGILAGDLAALLARFSGLKQKAFARTGKSFSIVVIQEAGLDGFWIHRVLQSEGIESYVVDPASIATSRRRRRAKTDRIDGEALVRALLAYKRGEPRVCAIVSAPTPEDEDNRRLCRERKALTAERIQHVNRIKGLLFSQGVSDYEPLRRNRHQRLDELKTGDSRPLPMHLKAQIGRELDRLELLLEQIKAVEAERDALLASAKPTEETSALPAMLVGLKGIGPEFAAVLWSEGLYRIFANRKQVAAYAGLAPTPWQSGTVAHEQGVSKAGNPRLRTTMIQLAWLWLRHQPHSALAQWFKERVKRNGGRLRKTTIVALARKLLVALWKYVNAGVVIEGAVMKVSS